jgi:hypothetical protein
MLVVSARADYYFKEVDEDFCALLESGIKWEMVKMVGGGAP